MTQLERITAYIEKHHCPVNFGGNLETEYDVAEGCINICTRDSKQTQLIKLLHELGHIKLESKLKQSIQYKKYVKAEGNGTQMRTNEYKVMLLQEEYMAWLEAEELVKIHKLKISHKKFIEVKTRCLMSYIKAAAEIGAIH